MTVLLGKVKVNELSRLNMIFLFEPLAIQCAIEFIYNLHSFNTKNTFFITNFSEC